MINSTLAELRNSKNFYNVRDIIHVFDGRKKEDIGYFIPKYFEKEFTEFLEKLEQKKESELLKKVSEAQKKDPIEEGGTDDGIE